MAGYRDVVAWQKAMGLAERLYRFAASLPPDERFVLAAQLRRAAVSVPSNIAEGHERRSRADYARFIAIACGSIAEIETQLELTQRLGIGDSSCRDEALRCSDELGRILRAIHRSLRTSAVSDDSAMYQHPSD